MVRRVFALALLLALSFLTMNCGSSTPSAPSTPTGVSGTGTLYTYIGDSPICDVLALRLNVTQMVLGVADSEKTVTVLSSLNTVISVDLASLQDAATPLAIGTINAGSYNRVSLDLTAGTMYVYDPSMNPPIRSVSANISTSTPPLFNIQPQLNLLSGGAALLSIDFDLQHMVQVDSNGNVTGVLTPFANVSAPTVSSTTGLYGSFSGIEGFLETVQANPFKSGNFDFTGAVSVQSLPPTNGVGGGPAVTAAFTGATAICGQPVPPQLPVSNTPCTSQPLNTILTNSYALLDGVMDSGANFETSSITIGPQEDPADNMVALIGPVLSVTTDSAGDVTGFTMFLQKTEPPPVVSAVSLDTAVSVTLPPGIVYNTYPPAPAPGTSIPSANFASLPFAPSEIAVGEDVVVHGVYTVPASVAPPGVTPPVNMVADEVDLKLQTLEGSFTTLLAEQSDDHTGVFTLSPCATLLQRGAAAALPVYVVTSPSTAFVSVNGLSSLSPQHNLLLKGLLFYEPQSITLNGFAIPAGKLVMLAEQINQIS
jgi:Domain of unknown function (DUF4382)